MDIDELIKKEFQLDDGLIYLNHAAVAPWPKRTMEAVQRFGEENCRTGAMHYARWTQTENKLRKQLQWLINAPSVEDIALLKNTSEALSVVAEGIDWQPGDNIVTSSEEFPSNRIPWQAQEDKGTRLREVDISTDSPEQQLINACDKKTRLLTISSIQYSSGRRLNLEILGRFCHENRILFCIDAIQSLGVIPFDAQAIKADFVMADAHKWMLGPEGIALFYCAPSVRPLLKLHQFGWHMVEDMGNYDRKDWQAASSARRFECGSPNMLGIHALSASLSLFEAIGMDEISKIIMNNTRYIFDYIKDNNSISLLTPDCESQFGGIVSFRIIDQDNGEFHHKLLNNKVICAHRAGGIRLSPHFYTPLEKINKALDIIRSSL